MGKNIGLISFEQLANAFIDILDGVTDWREIQHFTGLSDERCKDIYNIFSNLLEK